MPAIDVQKRRATWTRWYERNKSKWIAVHRKRQDEKRAWFKEFKKTLKCSRCPETHPAALDFHHKDPSKKEISLGKVLARGWSKARILAEIAKYEVLCSNCHRKLHYEEET